MENEANFSKEITELVSEELRTFKDSTLRQTFTQFLVRPYLQVRHWGKPPHQEVLCWIVADFQVQGFKGRGVGAAYCRQGHGENGYYWNLVFLKDEDYVDAGNNNCYRTLEELAMDSGHCEPNE